jgi:hypothetical protein
MLINTHTSNADKYGQDYKPRNAIEQRAIQQFGQYGFDNTPYF